jgi:hypothetical protein
LGGILELPNRFGQSFLKSITAPDAFKDIGNGMKLMKPMMNLESCRECEGIVVRCIVQKFWEACLKKCSETTPSFRVCAVGTPGIGKTVTTPVLLWLILQQGATIVYHCCDEKPEDGRMYEFVPCRTGSTVAYKYHCFAYKEPGSLEDIASLHAKGTFYIVDPGKSKRSCNPSLRFFPKVVIVASPNEEHWGGSSRFLKNVNRSMGTFLYYPSWTLEELLQAHGALNERFPEVTLSERDLRNRFFKVGGVPRTLFLPDQEFQGALGLQDKALDDLDKRRLDDLVFNSKNSRSFRSSQARSALLGYLQTDDASFETQRVRIVSCLARAKIYDHYRQKVWNLFCSTSDVTCWKIFEDYTSLQMVGKERKYEWKLLDETTTRTSLLKLGGCECLFVVDDIIAEACQTSNVVFCPRKKQYPLVDFAYSKDGSNGRVVHYFQATIGETHSSNTVKIKELADKSGGHSKMSLYYLVIPPRFDKFTLTFKKGQRNTNAHKTMIEDIMIVKVIGPSEEPIFAAIASEASPDEATDEGSYASEHAAKKPRASLRK